MSLIIGIAWLLAITVCRGWLACSGKLLLEVPYVLDLLQQQLLVRHSVMQRVLSWCNAVNKSECFT